MPEAPTQAITRLFSWLRQGLHAGITAGPVGTVAHDGHLPVPIRLRVNNTRDIDVPVQVYGPGDVTGIDPREVIRTEPHHLVTDFEPNYFPLIEFDRPDFPWLFTPIVADASGHLQPWICLVVVRRNEAAIVVPPNQPLPVLECSRKELPNLAEAWSWAHAQIVEGDKRVMDSSLDAKAQKKALSAVLKRNPERTVSRLLSPRRLDPNTSYYACLVPAFEVGRKAGLGETVTADEERALKPSWLSGTGAAGNDLVKLPVYYYWEFSTGSEGDFEALARRLERRKLPATLGLRPMNISAPNWGMPELPSDAPTRVLGLEGALRTSDTKSTPWPKDAQTSFQKPLRKLLNTPAEQASPDSEASIVGPPLYGQWHAKQRTVPDGDNPPHWFRELNLDPRNRVAAGLGTQVVRYEQEQLMASAWEQLAQHQQDNERLKRAQLSEAVGEVLSDKHFQPLPLRSFLAMTAPVRSAVTEKYGLRPNSVVPRANFMVSAAFRRIARQRGPLARRMAAAAQEKVGANATRTSRTQQFSEGQDGLRALARSVGIIAGQQPSRIASASSTLMIREAEAPTDVAIRSLQIVKTGLLKELRASSTVLAAVRRDIPNAESTDLIRFAPEFSQPMYEPLRDYFQDMLLPGLEQVSSNTISLLETNPRFIEAYMVGLNHEMARELLWRGFPTDQRGTYFRQFWDIRGRVPAPKPDERDGLKDIPAITEWTNLTHLGENAGKGSSQGQIVLLLRGDLLRRYPRAIVYAAEAVWAADGKSRDLGTEERYPIFRATRAPDVTMLGFPLTEQQVRGAEKRSEGHPGWFFILQQQPTEPRFGLDGATSFGDVPQHWNDLSWGHLAADENALKQMVYVPIDGRLQGRTLDSVQWGENSAQMAFITRQRPFRIAIHARTWLTGI